MVLLYEPLHLLRVVVDAVGRERETVGVKPMVLPSVHLRLQVVADLVYQFYLQERLAADEVPDNAFLSELLFAIENIVNSLLCHLPSHPLLRVLAHQVAVLTGQLAVLRHDERDGLRHAVLPATVSFFNIRHYLYPMLLQVV